MRENNVKISSEGTDNVSYMADFKKPTSSEEDKSLQHKGTKTSSSGGGPGGGNGGSLESRVELLEANVGSIKDDVSFLRNAIYYGGPSVFAFLLTLAFTALSWVDNKFDNFDAKYDAKFDSVYSKFDRVDVKFDAFNSRLDSMGIRLDDMNTQFNSMNNNLTSIRQALPKDNNNSETKKPQD